MYIEHLSLQNFRNYARLEVSLPAGPILLHGSNAQGKTSLLEAIYYLATSRSPYTTTDRQLINWNADRDLLSFAKIGAEVISAGRTLSRVEVTLVQEPGALNGSRLQKDIRINGVPRRVMDLIGKINVVMFLPQDLVLVEGSPAERRRYMNVTLCQTDPAYCEALATFEKALTQRNALLKRIGDGEARPEELAYWNEQLAQAGGVLVAGRQRLLRDLEVRARRVHRDLSGGEEDLELSYQPSFLPTANNTGQLSFEVLGLDLNRQLKAADIAAQYARTLDERRGEDIARGMTLIGPQRDELRLLVNTRDLGLYGSRGQARTAVMSLKLAELEWMRDTVGEWPILLLDEVIAELDAARRAYLLERISGAEQVLLTTTEPDIFTPEFLSKATRWRIRQGQIVDAS
ncbi:MAG: DNA replication/repair protein RecF [Anaerolineae bacterium]|jgi:DNA replication and repair protein RecF|nr:DNA replication/repair protein RecF [Anaerolineae bacterium]